MRRPPDQHVVGNDRSSDRHRQVVLAQVENVGPGIAAADRERIFEPFMRAGTALAQSRVVGVGLGLAIARALAEAQQGTLTLLDSPAGTTRFVLSLPAAEWNESLEDAGDPPT